jgi:amino acid adenylation domain-containing protein
LIEHLAQELGLQPDALDVHTSFDSFGLSSREAVALSGDLEEWLACRLSPTLLWEHQTIADLARYLAESAAEALPRIYPRPRDGEISLSFAQERVWFLERLAPGISLYTIGDVALRLSGSLDVPALEKSLVEIVRRHEALRTTFSEVNGRPVQIIHPSQPLAVSLVDLSSLAPEQREAEALRILTEEVQRPFDLRTGPLLRAVLVRLAADEHILALPMHHIISDGWSAGILLGELQTLYAAFSQGQPSPLAELPIQYADYAAWQREWLQGDLLQTQLAYWREQLAGCPELLALPTDRPRPPIQTYAGRRVPLALPAELTAALHALSRQEGATLFMTLLAAFQTLLFRYTGQAALVVGTPIANRDHPAVRELIGFFVNTLVLRGDLSGNPSFRELLGRVRSTALAAYEHQELPFERLVAELQPTRDLSRSPLFQVMFVLQNVPAPGLRLPELMVKPLELEPGTTKFDLTLSLGEGAAGLTGWLAYNTALFEEDTVRRMAGHFITLLRGVVANPECRLADLPLLTGAERQQLLVEWNATAAAYPERCIHELCEEQADRTPDAVAVECAGQTLSYAELDRRANQVAHYLGKLGVGPETLVGLCVERSCEAIVGLLGILKAGGAYLPLDPAYPAARLAFMLADAQAPVLLTQERLLADGRWLMADGRWPMADSRELTPDNRELTLDNCELTPDLRIVRLDADWPAIAQEPTSKAVSAVGPDNLAYVIYTSGSTGTPKGVALAHRGLSNLVNAQLSAFAIDASARVLQFASLSFDAAASEIFTALVSGATLVLARQEELAAPERLVALLREQRITVVTLPPSLLRLLPRVPLPTLRTLVSAGEACSWDLVAAWAPGRRFVNAYGPTEATIGPVCGEVTAQVAAQGPVPIGRPIANLQVYVLDAAGQPVPVGVAGELYLAGLGLARGYLGRPELTAERFVPHPFSAEPGARLYRTGDRVRYRPDGRLEFLGRLDQQVKVRGYRVELAEIEAVLSQHPGVAAAAVVAPDDGRGPRLVAYVVPTAEPSPTSADLRRFLAGRLPDYLLPAAFVSLAQLPRTPSGKLDRAALPAPEPRPPSASGYVAPTSRLEQALAQLWAEVLQVAQVGVADNFFELGGDSIRGAILINRLEQLLGQPVYVVALFEAPTISGLAAYLMQHYPAAVTRLWGAAAAAAAASGGVTAAQVAQLRALIPALPAGLVDPTTPDRNRPAVFVLAPPRSGTTLLRALLGGHPQLFAPPELELLSFNTLAERAAALTGRYAFWREGVVRGLMELHHCAAEAAQALMAEREARGQSVKSFYRELQGWLGSRLLVDKTPAYALDGAILARMEEEFQEARYLYLLRHPQAVVQSFVEAKLEQVFFRYSHPFPRRELAELIWLVCHENILAFLSGVPAGRQLWLRFEELVQRPEATLRGVCAFLGLPFAPAMLEPYGPGRMTDGIHPLAKMLGDVKFHQHRGIKAAVAERWQQAAGLGELGEPTWALAEQLGYARPATAETPAALVVAGLPALRPVPRAGELPLSFGQQRLWFLDRLAPASPFYNMPAALRLNGALDVAALSRALSEIVRRHEALRTSFPTVAGRPVQRIAPALALPLPVTDLTGLSADVRAAEVQRLATAEAERPFDLASGPLLRATLLRLTEREHVLLLTMHHIVADGWSIGVFIRELTALYSAFAAGQPSPLAELPLDRGQGAGGRGQDAAGLPPPLPELPLQYADYACWQREWLQGETLAEQLAYWKAQLAGSPPVLALPTDRPRPRVQTYHGANYPFTLAADVVAQLRALGRQEGATLFMTLLAAFQALLFRYSGQERINVGVPIANRNRAELEGLIGFFVNTLVMSSDLSGNPTFRELLGRVRQVALGAYRHQDLPFELLVEALQPERSTSHSPLFQVAFILQNAPISPLQLPGLKLSPVQTGFETAKLDLAMIFGERPNGLNGTVRYNTDLFDAGTIERLAGHFVTLLAGIAANPDEWLADLPILTDAERRQLLVEWNATAAPCPADHCIHELFEEQVARTPDALAVTFEGRTLTYAELDRRANQLAHHLRKLGVGPETIVGLCVERSPELLVGLLGILKAGGAYLPLDPAYPAARLAFMLNDAHVSVLLTQERLVADGGWPMADGRWPMANGRWQMADGGWPRTDN